MSKHLADVHVCESCHHIPSMRETASMMCYCQCHDVADAAPELLAACKAMVECRQMDAGFDISLDAISMMREAIAKAEGP